MKTPYRFLALAAVMAFYPVAASHADSTTPPTEQGSTAGTTPPKTSTVDSSDTTSSTNTTTPKLDNKVPPGNNASPSH